MACEVSSKCSVNLVNPEVSDICPFLKRSDLLHGKRELTLENIGPCVEDVELSYELCPQSVD